jgi:hypothetical protein
MERNMELIRKILLHLEEKEDVSSFNAVNIEGYHPKVVSYHIKLLSQAGLIEAKSLTTKDTHGIWWAKSLTWYGHDYIESVKNDTIWNKTKEGIKSKGLELGQVSFEVLKEYAKLQIKEKLGI